MAAHPKPHASHDVSAHKYASTQPANAKRKHLLKSHSNRGPIAAAKAKTHFLQLLDEVERDHRPITITKRGRVVAQLISASDPQPISKFDQVFGRMAGTVKITGDIVSPDWEQWGPEWR
jgi:prevent-host-death family protein